MGIAHTSALVLLAAAAMQLSAAAAAGDDRDSGGRIDASTVRAHMEFLASDALNGRGSGTRDEWITATYIAAQLRRSGLQPLGDQGDFVQTVQIDRTEVVGAPVLHIAPGTDIPGAQILVMRLNAAAYHGPLQKYRAGVAVQTGAALLMPEDAVPGNGPELQSAGLVLWHETAARRARWSDLSARAITVGRPRIVGLPASPASAAASQIMLAADAYATVAKLAEGSIATLTADTREASSRTWNAVGTLVGSGDAEKNAVILLSAHLDHLGARDTGVDRIYNGADDDASGSIAVLVLAEALAKGKPLQRSVVFAWFGSEEAGGYGARYFVEKPVVPLDRVVANLEFEMIGRPDGSIAAHTLWLTGWDRTNLGPELASHGARLVADPHPAENFFMRSDNITLARRGVVAQTVSSFGLHADYHQPSDDITHIDFGHMTQAIQSMLAPIRWLADSSFKPDWVQGGRPPAN
jgi:Peptidase family M28